MKIKLIIISALFFSSASSAQSVKAEKNIRSGNEFYKQQEYEKAASAYGKAIEADPNSSKAKFNLANTLYKQDKQDESIKIFAGLANDAEKSDIKEKAFYNKGAVLSRQKKLEESIEAYKNSLRLNPDDKEARENLQKALLELKKKKQPEKKDEQEKKKKQQEQQQKEQQPRISPKEAEQRLKLLDQKEKQVQERIQNEKSKVGGSLKKDW